MFDTLKDYLKKKRLGFYFIVADIVLAVILGIMFFATYKGDNGNNQLNMANDAYANIPEIIGLFAFLGAMIDVAALLVPELPFLHVFALACYGVSFGKEVFTIADVLAGLGTGIGYAGGNPALLLTWTALQVIILGIGIAAIFIGTEKGEEENLGGDKPPSKEDKVLEEAVKNA